MISNYAVRLCAWSAFRRHAEGDKLEALNLVLEYIRANVDRELADAIADSSWASRATRDFEGYMAAVDAFLAARRESENAHTACAYCEKPCTTRDDLGRCPSCRVLTTDGREAR